jgi:hypothetical protein
MRAGPRGLRLEGPPTRGSRVGASRPFAAEKTFLPVSTGDILFDVAVNRGDGTLYAVVRDARFSGLGYDTIALTRSTDGGHSWSRLVRINPGSDAGARVDDRQAFNAGRTCGRRGHGHGDVYDFRNNTAADGILATDQWAVHCHPASEDCSRSAGWNEETRVTPASFDMRQAPFALLHRRLRGAGVRQQRRRRRRTGERRLARRPVASARRSASRAPRRRPRRGRTRAAPAGGPISLVSIGLWKRSASLTPRSRLAPRAAICSPARARSWRRSSCCAFSSASSDSGSTPAAASASSRRFGLPFAALARGLLHPLELGQAAVGDELRVADTNVCEP